MKKFFTLFSFLLAVAAASAQDVHYAFADKDGNLIPDGTTIVCSEAEDDGFGGVIVNSGLHITNVAAPSNYQVSITANVTRMDNGSFQLCFPQNCLTWNTTGVHEAAGKGPVAQGELKNILSEWLPVAEGQCVATYTAKSYQGAFAKQSYTVTVVFKYGAAAINATAGDTPGVTGCYNLQGCKATGRSGLLLQRMSDGSVRKLLKK